MDAEHTALIDGDPIVYSVAFSMQQYALLDIGNNGHMIDVFNMASEARQHAEDLGLEKEEVEVTPYVEETEETDDLIYSSLHNFIADITESVDAHHARIYITGKSSFRKDIAPDYKENRKSFVRPLLYHRVKQCLTERLGAEYAPEGWEADDSLADEAHKYIEVGSEEGYTICTIDKDLDTVPGWHYRWQTWNKPSGHYWVAPESAQHIYWISVLTGDGADNIIGLHRVGPKTAEKWVVGCNTPKEYYDACLAAYESKHRTQDDLEKNMQLLRLGTDRRQEMVCEGTS